jgi:hypothetical protein
MLALQHVGQRGEALRARPPEATAGVLEGPLELQRVAERREA